MPYFLLWMACAIVVWIINPLAFIFIGIAVLRGLWPQIKLILMMLGVLPGYKELEEKIDALPVVYYGVTVDDGESALRAFAAADKFHLEEHLRKKAANSKPADRRSPRSFDLAPEDYRAIPDSLRLPGGRA